MKLRVLGCSGGIDGDEHRTTAFLLDHDILLDAGTGLCALTRAEMAPIDHVFITHAHLDHIAALPLMLDAVSSERKTPVTVYAIDGVIQALRQHVFNNVIWPDFTKLPNAANPWLRFQSLQLGEVLELDGRKITPIPVDHTVPAVGYCVDSGRGSLIYSGDTGPCDAFWQAVNLVQNLRYLIIECAFPDTQSHLARLSKHFCPSSLKLALSHLERTAEIMLTHLKPGVVSQALSEIDRACLGNTRPSLLRPGLCLTF